MSRYCPTCGVPVVWHLAATDEQKAQERHRQLQQAIATALDVRGEIAKDTAARTLGNGDIAVIFQGHSYTIHITEHGP